MKKLLYTSLELLRGRLRASILPRQAQQHSLHATRAAYVERLAPSLQHDDSIPSVEGSMLHRVNGPSRPTLGRMQATSETPFLQPVTSSMCDYPSLVCVKVLTELVP
eukprot:2891078-Amphidinium_carterae.1